MKKQKIIIISVVSTILLIAIIGISMLLNNQTVASECKHACDAWEDYINVHSGRCKYCGIPMAEPHTYVNGECIKCGAKQSNNCKHTNAKWKSNSTEHWQVCNECGIEIAFTRTNHTFKEGVCTICSYNCRHSDFKWKSNESGHWKECTNCGYQTIKEKHGTNGRKYENTATCTRSGYKQYVCLECGDIYDREFSPALGHNYVTKSNSTYHWKECSRCDSDTYDNKEKHIYQNGVCIICSYKCTHEQTEWKNNDTEHWLACKSCNMIATSSQAKHKYVNGKCSVCLYECTHKVIDWKSNDSEHWKVCLTCEKEIANTRKAHTYKNGKCSECSYSCKHSSRTWKRDENSHWQECKICSTEIPNTRATHIITKWEKFDKNTHTGTCTVCNKIVRENHKYENKVCKCGQVEESTEPVECKHTERNGYQMLTHIGKYVKIVEKKFQEQEHNILLKMENVKTVVMVAHIAK